MSRIAQLNENKYCSVAKLKVIDLDQESTYTIFISLQSYYETLFAVYEFLQ